MTEHSTSEAIMLSKPQQIDAFVLMQVYFKLKLEVSLPNGPKWRVSPMNQARSILLSNDQPNPGRTKKKVLAAYRAWLIERGVLNLENSRGEVIDV